MVWNRPPSGLPPQKPLLPLQPPQREKRYGWWRAYNDLSRHPKWRVIARLAQPDAPMDPDVSVSDVLAVVLDLLCTASKAKHRGRIDDWKPLEAAAALDMPLDKVLRIRAALEDSDVGWVDQDFIVDWHERQPDSEDPTANERQQRRRKLMREKRLGKRLLVESAAQDSSAIGSRVTLRDSVTVTLDKTRQTTNENTEVGKFEQGPRLQELGKGEGVEKAEDKEFTQHKARVYLFGTGTQETGLAARVVCERMGYRVSLSGHELILRWHREVNDALALANIITEADALALNGRAFENIVLQQIARHVAEQKNGPSLPLPLTPLKKPGK